MSNERGKASFHSRPEGLKDAPPLTESGAVFKKTIWAAKKGERRMRVLVLTCWVSEPRGGGHKWGNEKVWTQWEAKVLI